MKQFVAFWRAEVIGVFEFLDECEEACPDVFDTSDGGLQGLLFPKTGIPFDCDLIFPVEVDLEEKIVFFFFGVISSSITKISLRVILMGASL